MGKIIKLHPRGHVPSPEIGADRHPSRANSSDHATQRLGETVGELIRTLEASHRRIRALITTIPDAEVSARLSRDLAVLSAALRDAKAKAASIGLIEAGD